MWRVGQVVVEYNALVLLLSIGGSYTWQGETYTGAEPDAGTLPYLCEKEVDVPAGPGDPAEEPVDESVEGDDE